MSLLGPLLIAWSNNVGDSSNDKYVGNDSGNKFCVYTTGKVIFGVKSITQ